MARKLPAKDVVIIGLGWTGSILGYELAKAEHRYHRDQTGTLARHCNRFPARLCSGRASLRNPA